MYSHLSRSETRSFFGSLRYRLFAQIHLTAHETHIMECHRLNRIEVFYDPIRDALNANAESAHKKAKARGWFVTRARDASAICAAETRALAFTIRALFAFNITLDDLVRGVTITHYSLRSIAEVEQVLIDCIDHIDRWLQSARRYAEDTEDIFEPGSNDSATMPPNQWPLIWMR
jgi:hypothetical protein